MATQRGGTDWLRAQAKRVTSGGDLAVTEQQAASVAVERWLQERKVDYAPPTEIPMSLIDERKSRGNQARSTPIVPESVDRFAIAMKGGASFPPIVVYPQGGKLIIIDGNNRQAARSRAGFNTILGIVISEDTPGELIQLLTVEANAHHGVTPDLQWRLRQAFHLISMGFTHIQAADACSVTPQQISNALRVQEADAKARNLKILGFSDLPITARAMLGSVKDDAVFSRMARLAISSGMTIADVTEMNRMVKGYHSESARLEALDALAQERGLATASKRVHGKAPAKVQSSKSLFVSGIGMLLRADEALLAKTIVTANDKKAIKERINAAEEKLKAAKVAVDMVDVED